ncbi:MAG: type II toxin-antitoxin system Phd/YefM family antitoxin [Candidatus Limnocylindria bacterium]
MKRPVPITVTEFARNLSRFIHRVAHEGERFILLKGGRPVAEVSPPPRGRRLGELKEVLASLPHLGPDDAASFARDLEAARASLDVLPAEDHWES